MCMKARADEESEKLNFYHDHILIAQGLSLVSAEVYVCCLLGFQRVDKTVGHKNVIVSMHVCLARFKTMYTPYKHFVLKYAD